jgi:hypothetical protein
MECGIDASGSEFVNRPARRPINRAGLVYDQTPVRTAKIPVAAEAMQHSFTSMMKPEEDSNARLTAEIGGPIEIALPGDDTRIRVSAAAAIGWKTV